MDENMQNYDMEAGATMDENMQNYDMEAGAGADIPPEAITKEEDV